MQVAITGGTGFVGSHTVAAVANAGHDVRLLVRSPDRVAPAMQPLGVDPADLEVVVADVTDRAAVAAGLDGVDAVIHAASVYTLDPRRVDEITATNEAGVRNVLETAVAAGLDPIIHVSSVVALHREGEVGATVTPDSPVGNSPHPYGMSKARQEEFARRLQDDGAPVVITNPGGVLGPHDPHDGESVRTFRSAVKGKLDLMPDIGYAWVDVRDLAEVHVAALQPGKGPRRYLAGAHTVAMRPLTEMITRANGKQRRPRRVPMGLARPVAALGGPLRRIGIDSGASLEALWSGARMTVTDNSLTESELGVTFRPTEESVIDQVRWMQETGRI